MKTLNQASKITGIHPDNLRQRIHRGTLKAVKRGRDWFVSEREIDRLMGSCACANAFQPTQH